MCSLHTLAWKCSLFFKNKNCACEEKCVLVVSSGCGQMCANCGAVTRGLAEVSAKHPQPFRGQAAMPAIKS